MEVVMKTGVRFHALCRDNQDLLIEIHRYLNEYILQEKKEVISNWKCLQITTVPTTRNGQSIGCTIYPQRSSIKKHIKVFDAGGICAICLESLNSSNEILLICGHIFHHACVSHRSIDKCPLCRTKLKTRLVGASSGQAFEDLFCVCEPN